MMKKIILLPMITVMLFCIISCKKNEKEKVIGSETIFDAIKLSYNTLPSSFQKGLYDVCHSDDNDLKSLYEQFNKNQCKYNFAEIETYEEIDKNCFENYYYVRGLLLGYSYKNVIKEFEHSPEITETVKKKRQATSNRSLVDFLAYVDAEENLYLYYLYKINNEYGAEYFYSNPAKIIPKFSPFSALKSGSRKNDIRKNVGDQNDALNKISPYVEKLKRGMSLEEVNHVLKEITVHKGRKDYHPAGFHVCYHLIKALKERAVREGRNDYDPVISGFDMRYHLIGDYQIDVRFHYNSKVGSSVRIGEIVPLMFAPSAEDLDVGQKIAKNKISDHLGSFALDVDKLEPHSSRGFCRYSPLRRILEIRYKVKVNSSLTPQYITIEIDIDKGVIESFYCPPGVSG